MAHYRRLLWALALSTVFTGRAFGIDSTTNAVEDTTQKSTLQALKENFGVNYNSFFAGPGIGQPLGLNPGMTGQPSDTGLNFFNLVSVKWKATNRFAVDLQFRNQLVVTNKWEFRHQGQRLGISGAFLKGEDWAFAGALNSDVPIGPLMGQIPTERTLLFNPGFFATFNYGPKDSRWSMFALVAPRVWFYRDRNAVSRQDAQNGGTKFKPEWTFYLNPSVNYALDDNTGLRLGTTIEYTKFVGLGGPLRNYMPLEFGMTYEVSPALSVYTYLLSSTPLDDGLRTEQGFPGTPWWKTVSLNVWLSGTLF